LQLKLPYLSGPSDSAADQQRYRVIAPQVPGNPGCLFKYKRSRRFRLDRGKFYAAAGINAPAIFFLVLPCLLKQRWRASRRAFIYFRRIRNK
jgi:hypothetical protein